MILVRPIAPGAAWTITPIRCPRERIIGYAWTYKEMTAEQPRLRADGTEPTYRKAVRSLRGVHRLARRERRGRR